MHKGWKGGGGGGITIHQLSEFAFVQVFWENNFQVKALDLPLYLWSSKKMLLRQARSCLTEGVWVWGREMGVLCVCTVCVCTVCVRACVCVCVCVCVQALLLASHRAVIVAAVKRAGVWWQAIMSRQSLWSVFLWRALGLIRARHFKGLQIPPWSSLCSFDRRHQALTRWCGFYLMNDGPSLICQPEHLLAFAGLYVRCLLPACLAAKACAPAAVCGLG